MLTLSTPWLPRWLPELIGTLVFVVRDREVLLIHKKTGHGAGKVNGPGGKWEAGETLEGCALRELYEEVGIAGARAECRAEMRFVEEDGPQWLGFAFVVTEFSGEAIETREADPFWCAIDAIPFERMWPDDRIWLPDVLSESAANSIWVGDFLFRAGELLAHQTSSDPSVYHRLNQI